MGGSYIRGTRVGQNMQHLLVCLDAAAPGKERKVTAGLSYSSRDFSLTPPGVVATVSRNATSSRGYHAKFLPTELVLANCCHLVGKTNYATQPGATALPVTASGLDMKFGISRLLCGEQRPCRIPSSGALRKCGIQQRLKKLMIRCTLNNPEIQVKPTVW